MRKSGAFSFLDEDLMRSLTELEVSPSDVEEKFVRGAGPGGQKINKTSSTVWLLHRPTGLQVRCQSGRSQHQNRLGAWMELANKLRSMKSDALAKVRSELEAERRRTRPKTRAQKRRMLETKKVRAQTKSRRARFAWE